MNEYDDLADLDDVFRPLRSVARPAELSQESAMVDLMVNARRTAEGKHMFRSRSARIATLVAAGVLGFGGMAAAGSPISEEVLAAIEKARSEQVTEPEVEEPEVAEDEVPEEEAVVEEEVPEEEAVVEEEILEPETLEVKVTEEEPSEDTPTELVEDPNPETDFNEANCAEGNHGKTVSAVARGDSEFLEKYAENNPGAAIPTARDAAHSLCGKTQADESDMEIDEEVEAEVERSEESEVEETEEPKVKAERPGKSADGPGNGKSNGNGNGKRGG